jgi:hypothetical protein
MLAENRPQNSLSEKGRLRREDNLMDNLSLYIHENMKGEGRGQRFSRRIKKATGTDP